MIRNIILFILALIASVELSTGQHQGAHIAFDKEKHNFGTIKENQGSVTYKFNFTNTGNQPLILQNVRASCGCTTPNYSREPVLPGAKGFINVAYNPKGRPGPFEKSITVTSNADNGTEILRISGDVETGPKSIEEQYRVGMDALRLKSRSISVSNIEPGQKKSQTMDIYNNGDVPLKVEFIGIPSHVELKTDPEVIRPNSKGEIHLQYNASEVQDWGSVNNWVRLKLNGKATNHRIVVHANIEEDFSQMSNEELAQAPKAEFSENQFDFGSIKEGDVVEHTFELTNTGANNLIIRKVSASCGCTAVKPDKSVIDPGESTDIKVVFNSRGKKGNQNKAVTVITNDPRSTKKILWVKGTVN